MSDLPSSVKAEARQAGFSGERLFLTFLILMFVLKGIAFALLVPPWQGPDEPANFSAIAAIANVKKLTGPPGETISTALEESVRHNDFWHLRAWPSDFDGEDQMIFFPSGTFSLYNYVSAPVFAAGAAGGILGALYSIRILSVLFGGAAVLFTYLLAKQLRIGAPWLPALAAGVVALMPQFGFITSVVNKDSLAAAMGAATLWATAYVARAGPSLRRLLLVGGVFLAGILVKPTLAALVGMVVVTLIVAWRPRLWRWGILALSLGFVSVLLAAIARQVPLGQALGLHRLVELARTVGRPSIWLYVLPQAWGHFGWVNAPLNPDIYVVLFALMGLSGAGLIVFLVRRFRYLLRNDRPAAAMLAGNVTAVIGLTLMVMYAQVSVIATQGRFWFPAIGAFAVLFTLGLGVLIPPLTSRLGVFVWICMGLALNVWVLLAQLPARFGVL